MMRVEHDLQKAASRSRSRELVMWLSQLGDSRHAKHQSEYREIADEAHEPWFTRLKHFAVCGQTRVILPRSPTLRQALRRR